MRILAIDPGQSQSSWVLYETREKRVCHSGTAENRLVVDTLHRPGPDWVVIEMVASYGMPVGREVFDTCVWIGRFIEARTMTKPHGLSLLYRKDVKLHLCGSPRANDGTIRKALMDKLGPKGTKKKPGPLYGIKNDQWQALALAVTWAETGEGETL